MNKGDELLAKEKKMFKCSYQSENRIGNKLKLELNKTEWISKSGVYSIDLTYPLSKRRI